MDKGKGKVSTTRSKGKTTTSSRTKSRRSSVIPGKQGRYLDIIYNLNNSTGDISGSRSRRRRNKKQTFRRAHSLGDKPIKSFEHPGVSYKILVQYNKLTPAEKQQLQDDFDNYVYGTSHTQVKQTPHLHNNVFLFAPKKKELVVENPFTHDDMIFINFLHQKYHTIGNIPEELQQKLLNKENGQEEIDNILASEEYKRFHAKHYRFQGEQKERMANKKHVSFV
jgi:hypothetical protein